MNAKFDFLLQSITALWILMIIRVLAVGKRNCTNLIKHNFVYPAFWLHINSKIIVGGNNHECINRSDLWLLQCRCRFDWGRCQCGHRKVWRWPSHNIVRCHQLYEGNEVSLGDFSNTCYCFFRHLHNLLARHSFAVVWFSQFTDFISCCSHLLLLHTLDCIQ